MAEAHTNSNIFKNVEAFKHSIVNYQTIYIEELEGGFFVRASLPIKPDNNFYLERKDGVKYIREEYSTKGIIRPEWFGAKGDGRTDDWQSFNEAIQKAGTLRATFVTSSKKYHLSKVIYFSPGRKDNNIMWEGNGAILDNAIHIKTLATTVRDLTVENSPNNGFVWTRGQGGLYSNLKAINCKEIGFLIGTKDRSQVAWSTFTNLVATDNNIGFLIDGSGEKSWVNANIFDGFFARNNDTHGVKMLGTANYNTFTGLHCEGNAKNQKSFPAMLIEMGIDNIFVGGHLVAGDNSLVPVVIDNGIRNSFVGGRYVAGKNGKEVIKSPKGNIELSRQVIRRPKKRKDIPKGKF